MKVTKAFVGLAAAAAALTVAPLASAQTNEGFTLGSTEYGPGETVSLAYDATADCEGKASSDGFVNRYSSEFRLDPPNVMRADATSSFVAGSYTAQMTCGGELTSRVFKVVAKPDLFFLDRAEVEAGGAVSVMKTKQSGCGDVATSSGFTAPIELKHDSANLRIGNGTAVDKAGTYEVKMICNSRAIYQKFVVTAKAPAAAQPQVTEKPKLKPPIVKPKGAPQTGGGGTA